MKVMSKALVDKGYYKQKVIDKYCGEIEMLENKHVLRVDQEDHSVVDCFITFQLELISSSSHKICVPYSMKS